MGEGCRSWRAERLRGLEGNRSTQRRKGAKAQRGVGRAGVQRRVAEGREAQRMGIEGLVSFAVSRHRRLP